MIGSSDARRASLYRRLAALEEAGIPLRTAVDQVAEPDLEPIGRALDDGLPPGEAWARAARFTPLEVTFVQAGARSGQLAENFGALSTVFEEAAQTKRSLLAGLAYPFILIHLAVLIPQVVVLVQQGVGPYLRVTILPLAVAYGALAVLITGIRGFARTSPAAAGAILQSIPLLGGFVRRKALAHGIGTLAAVYRAGVPVTEAVDAAASVATLHSVRAAFQRIRRRLDGGATIGDAFLEETTFPTEVREAGSTGSLTGKLDEQLQGARRRLESEANTQRALLITTVPIATYLLVALVIGTVVISMWNDIVLGPLKDALKGS